VLIRDGHLYHSHEEEVAATEALAATTRIPLWEHPDEVER
jgi:hypothetical protein